MDRATRVGVGERPQDLADDRDALGDAGADEGGDGRARGELAGEQVAAVDDADLVVSTAKGDARAQALVKEGLISLPPYGRVWLLAEQGIEGLAQLGQVEGLGQIAVDAELDHTEGLRRRGRAAHHHHQRCGVSAADRLEDLEPVAVRQRQIQQHEVGDLLREPTDRAARVRQSCSWSSLPRAAATATPPPGARGSAGALQALGEATDD